MEAPVEAVVETTSQALPEPLPTESSTNDLSGLSADFLAAGGDDDGCAITITETPSCEDDNNTDTNKSTE